MRTNLSALLAVLPSPSAAPLQMMAVVVVVCGFAGWSPAAIVHYGNDVAFPVYSSDATFYPNFLLGSKYTVTQPIVLQKAGIIFNGFSINNAKVGIYTDAGGAPNTLVAETALFEVYSHGVLETPLLTTPTIPAGDYWFMAVYDVFTGVGFSDVDVAQVAYIAHTFDSPLPATFPTPHIYTTVAINYYLVGETTISGDYNNNGTVDAADYVVWRKTGINGQQGYNDWRSHFGQTAGGGAVAGPNATVPEPTTLVMLIVAAAGLGLRCRHFAWQVPRTR